MKKVLLILRPGLQESFADKKNIILLLIIGFILDNGVRVMVDHAKQVGQPLGVFETFIMCLNHWYYLVIFLVGYVLILTTIPRLDSDQLLLIYRAGKKGWFFGELLQITLYSLAYILLLMAGCMVCAAKYCYIGNIWSNFTIYYKSSYEKLLFDNNRFIDQQVFKYYSPYQAVIHGVVLLLLCMVLMGTVTLYFSIMNKKLVAILLNVISILFVLIFNNYRIGAMWLSPFCHAVLALHNRYVYTEFSVSLGYSYAYLVLLEIIMIGLSIKQLKKKMFY